MNDSLENGMSLEQHSLEIGLHDKLSMSVLSDSMEQLFPIQKMKMHGISSCVGILGAAVGTASIGEAAIGIHRLFSFRDWLSSGKRVPDSKNEKTRRRLFSEKGSSIFEEITRMEKIVKNDDNYLILVAMASIFFETEINICLCERIRPIADELIVSVAKQRPKFNAEVLKAWAINRTDTTLAVITMILHGIRWSIEGGNVIIKNHLLSLFDQKFIGVATKKTFALAVNEIRETYRNQVLHGRKTVFSQAEYNTFAKLVIGEKLFTEWNRSSKHDFPTEYGILHDHILLAINYP